MSITKPGTLGIISCPGGREFVRAMIPHLRFIYKKRFDRLAAHVSKRYKISKDEALREISIASDLHGWASRNNGKDRKFAMPRFDLPVNFTKFANGEFKAEIKASVRGLDVYIVQDVENHYPVVINEEEGPQVLSINDHLLILFVTIDAAIRSGAQSVTLVLPAYPYARQHKRKGREGLTAAWFGQIVENMGVSRIITLDIHSREIQNTFSKTSMENLHASYQILRKLTEIADIVNDDIVVVSPDTGAIDRNKFYAESIHKPLALIYKERDYSRISTDASNSNITNMHLLGSVEGKTVFMADDMLGTGGTLIKAMKYLKEMGAARIICAVSLPLFTGSADADFEEAYKKGYFYRIIGTDAVFHDEDMRAKEWFVLASVTNLFSRIISRLHHGRSLSPLLDNRTIINRMINAAAEKRSVVQLELTMPENADSK